MLEASFFAGRVGQFVKLSLPLPPRRLDSALVGSPFGRVSRRPAFSGLLAGKPKANHPSFFGLTVNFSARNPDEWSQDKHERK